MQGRKGWFVACLLDSLSDWGLRNLESSFPTIDLIHTSAIFHWSHINTGNVVNMLSFYSWPIDRQLKKVMDAENNLLATVLLHCAFRRISPRCVLIFLNQCTSFLVVSPSKRHRINLEIRSDVPLDFTVHWLCIADQTRKQWNYNNWSGCLRLHGFHQQCNVWAPRPECDVQETGSHVIAVYGSETRRINSQFSSHRWVEWTGSVPSVRNEQIAYW